MTLEEIKKGGFDKYLVFFNEFPIESVSNWGGADNYIDHLKTNFKKIIFAVVGLPCLAFCSQAG